jgi:hypothetical protein
LFPSRAETLPERAYLGDRPVDRSAKTMHIRCEPAPSGGIGEPAPMHFVSSRLGWGYHFLEHTAWLQAVGMPARHLHSRAEGWDK